MIDTLVVDDDNNNDDVCAADNGRVDIDDDVGVDDSDVSAVDIDDADELVMKSITCKCFNSVYLLSNALDSEYIGVSP